MIVIGAIPTRLRAQWGVPTMDAAFVPPSLLAAVSAGRSAAGAGAPSPTRPALGVGIGPVCRVHGAKREDHEGMDEPALPFDPITGDVVAERTPDGLRFNIPRRHVHHAPTGFDFGHGGRGPADFALNILALFVAVPIGPEGAQGYWFDEAVELADGTVVSGTVWHLHQTFKWRFVAPLPREGGTIRGAEIRAWLRDQNVPADMIR